LDKIIRIQLDIRVKLAITTSFLKNIYDIGLRRFMHVYENSCNNIKMSNIKISLSKFCILMMRLESDKGTSRGEITEFVE
jgi:predicted nucleic-acid-binding Zn-ribbon protein